MMETRLSEGKWVAEAANGERLELTQRTPTLWQVTGAALTPSAAWVAALREFGRERGGEVLSNNTRTDANAVLQEAGWHLAKGKAFVERSLEQPVTVPPHELDFVSLAQVGRPAFVQALLTASEGDPFETSTPESAEQDFSDLVEYAGDAFDPEGWLLARQGGEAVGVVLPQRYPDQPHAGTLFYIGIFPQARGRGLGRVLHAEGLRRLQEQGVTLYQGSTDLRNEAMRRVFAANGCAEVRQQWFYAWPQE